MSNTKNSFGDTHTTTEHECCETCGRPLQYVKSGVEVDAAGFVTHGGRSIKLSLGEAKVFRVLHSTFGNVVHRNRIYDLVWGDRETELKIVDVLICKVRKKIEPLGLVITNTWGVGYTLSKAPAAKAAA